MPPQHWILTNRKVARRRNKSGKLEERILDERYEALPVFRVATFRPSDDPDPSFETLQENVEVIDDGYPASYEDVRPHSDASSLAATKRMFLELYQCMEGADAGRKDTLFFIHGFNYGWPDALLHLQKLHELYVEPETSPIGRIVYFTWPSWGSLRRYKGDQEIAAPSGQLLGRVFGKTVRFYRDFFGENERGKASAEDERPAFCGGRIHLMAHSMGAQVLTEMIRYIQPYSFLDLAVFGEVLILNADESWRGLEKDRPLFHLPDLAGRVHVYNHESDDALRISEWTKNSAKRLGRHGPRDLNKIPPRTLVVDCSNLNGSARPDAQTDTAMLQMARRVLEVHKKVNAKERLFDHWGYLNRPEVLLDIHAVLRGDSSSDMSNTRERRSDRLFRLR